MIAANYSNVRANLKFYIDKAKNDCEKIVITSKDVNAVLMSEEEYNNMVENLFIMSNHRMVQRLNESIQQIIDGKVIVTNLEELINRID